MATPFTEEPETARLLGLAASGDAAAAGMLLDHHRDRLTRMVRLRLDPRLKGRLGVSDVLQETYLEASQRLDEYFRSPDVPFYVWLRFLAAQRVLMLHRRHVQAKGRAVGREQPIDTPEGLTASSVSIAAELVGRETSPTRAALRAELNQRLTDAIESMEPTDREVLALRHFEQLPNVQVARILGLDVAAASKRYVRALRRLREIIGDHDLGREEGAERGGS